MKDIVISLMPSYYCEGECPYCYLGDAIQDQRIADLSTIQDSLFAIAEDQYNATNIDIFGGEPDLLPIKYLQQLVDLCKKIYPHSSITISSGCVNGNSFCIARDSKINIAVSLNKERPLNSLAEKFLLQYKETYKNISILQVVLPSLLRQSPVQVLDYLQQFQLPVSFLRYFPSTSACRKYSITGADYSKFIQLVYNQYRIRQADPYMENYSFKIINPTIDTVGSPLSSTNIFIDPQGRFGHVEYNNKGQEYFVFFDTFQQWKNMCIFENKRYTTVCGKCKYFNNCFAEHLNFNNINSQYCCGLPDLIEYFGGSNCDSCI